MSHGVCPAHCRLHHPGGQVVLHGHGRGPDMGSERCMHRPQERPNQQLPVHVRGRRHHVPQQYLRRPRDPGHGAPLGGVRPRVQQVQTRCLPGRATLPLGRRLLPGSPAPAPQAACQADKACLWQDKTCISNLADAQQCHASCAANLSGFMSQPPVQAMVKPGGACDQACAATGPYNQPHKKKKERNASS